MEVLMKMRILTITLTAIMTVSGAMPAAAKNISVPASGTVSTETESIQTEAKDNSFRVEIVDGLTVITPYYSITLPDHWADAYSFETVANFTGKWLKLFHTDPRTGHADGHLFSILLTKDEDYEIIPDHGLLGELEDTEENKYHVVAVFPTDVQYTREGRDAYMALFKDADTVLDSITAADGCWYKKS